jgi:N-acetyl-gamma-glutamyl-phosphate reductase
VRLLTEPPRTSQVSGTNFCDIYLTEDRKLGIKIAISAIDNLGKGASGQAVQNMNIMFGLPEWEGLKLSALPV